MKHLVEFPLEDGGSVVIEVDEPETSGTVRASRGDTLAKAKETLEEALNNVLPVTKSVGEKLTTTAGAVIASATAEANFDVTLRWTGKAKDEGS